MRGLCLISTSAGSKSPMCEFRSAIAGAIKGSRSLQEQKQEFDVNNLKKENLITVITVSCSFFRYSLIR